MKRNQKINRFISVCMSMLLLFTFVLPSSASIVAEMGSIGSCFNVNTAEILVNAYADTDVTFSISNAKSLKDTKGEIAYTLVELSPYGYAIFNNSNMILVEACFVPDSRSPISLNDERKIYYVGPTVFALKEAGKYISVENETVISDQTISDANVFESKICSANICNFNNSNTNQTQAIGAPISYSKSVGGAYFPNLNDFGKNSNNTCTVIAASMLLGYYDYKIHNSYIDSRYTTSATSTSSAGTTEEFHQLLCNYVYGTGQQGGIFIGRAASGINSYLRSRSIPVSLEYNSTHSVRTTQNKIINQIEKERPAIASFGKSYGGDIDHTVVVYGYSYISSGSIEYNSISAVAANVNYDTLMYRVHYGWKNDRSKRDVWLSSSWFYQYGHITNCSGNGTHYDVVESYLSDNYHSGNYHYYKQKLECCSCGEHTTYNWEQKKCNGNCIEIASVEEEVN